MPYKRIAHRKNAATIMIVSSVILGILVFASVIYFVRDIRITQDKVIVQHLAKLAEIFNHIQKTAQIIDFDHERNYIDFLNVKSFTGSEIGSMNLAYPEKWQGPYLESNLTIQERPYMVVKTKKGFFIIPGDGVRLSNGKIIGKDIPITYNSDIEELARNSQGLLFRNHGLAVKLNLNKLDETIKAFAEPISLIDDVS